MTDSTAEQQFTGFKAAPSIQSQAIQSQALDGSSTPAHERAQLSSQALTSIRGVPRCEQIQANALSPDSPFYETYSSEINRLWVVARINPREDRGGDLRNLIEAFETDAGLQEHQELISELAKVAKANVLFGKSREDFAAMGIDFEKFRREFLVDIIRGVINSDNITQGSEPLCTIASATKLLSKSEFLRLTTNLALTGQVTTKSGAVMQVWPEQFLRRASTHSEASLGDVKSARRSAGMLTVLYSVLQLGDTEVNPLQPLVERQEGMFWHQYTRMVQNLLGEKVACAHRTAKDISIDESTGIAVPKGAAGSKEVDLFGYLDAQLKRGRSVFIDTIFDFSAPGLVTGNEHCRHALVAERFEEINGERWVRCSNPIGDFVDRAKSRAGYAEFFRTGAVLGNPNGFWFKTDVNGDILVRADVLRSNIQTALVTYEEGYQYSQGDKPLFIGDESYESGRPIRFFDFSSDPSEIHTAPSRAESIADTLQRLFYEEEKRFGSQGPASDDGGYSRNQPLWKKRPEEELLAIFEEEVQENREEQQAKEKKRERTYSESAFHGEGMQEPMHRSPDSRPTAPGESDVAQGYDAKETSTPHRAAATTSLITKALFG